MRTRVYITVDVETSMGGAWRFPDCRPVSIDKTILGKLAAASYGLPLLVEELNKYAFRGTFFTEVFFSHCLGADQAKIVTDYLLSNRQDVQLHTHPVFRNYSLAVKEGTPEAFRRCRAQGDGLSGKDLDTQYTILSEACELFQALVGEHPIAYRAGGFRGDHNTLAALRRLEIAIDSSFNPSVAASFPRERPLPNVVQYIDGIVEMPLTTAMSGFNRFRGWKPMAISSVSFAELKTVLTQAQSSGVKDLVFIFHSFSTVKPRDVFYSSFRPDWMVISRFRRLLRYLADHGDMFEVCAIGDAVEKLSNLAVGRSAPDLDLGFVKPLIRKGTQAVNRAYWI